MKIILSLSILLIFNAIAVNPASALEIKDKNEYLIDVRGDDGDLYLNRLSFAKKLDSPDIKIFAFSEAQWNFYTTEWEKLLLGAGTGFTLYKYFCISQTIQIISGEMLDYMVFDVGSYSTDTTTRIGLHFPFLSRFSFQLYEEYSLNLEKGRGEYCETVAEISYRPKDLCSVGIGWRHTDRIHNLDTDYVSASLTLDF